MTVHPSSSRSNPSFRRRHRLLAFLVLLVVGMTAVGADPATETAEGGETSPRALYRKAHGLFSAGRFEEAYAAAITVFRQGHRSGNLLNLLAAIEVQLGRRIFAGMWLRKALCLDPNDANARRMLAQLPPWPRPIPLRPAQTREHLEEITRTMPELLARLNHPKSLVKQVFEDLLYGRFYQAAALAEECEKRFPGVESQGANAAAAMMLGHTAEALAIARRGLQQDPNALVLQTIQAQLEDAHPLTSAGNLARAYYDRDRWQEAETAARQISAAGARNAEGELVLARMALDRLDPVAAGAHLQEALRRDADNPLVHLYTVDLALLNGNPNQAGKALDLAWRRGYHLPSVRLRTGLALVTAGSLDEARHVLGEAENMMPFLDRDAWPMMVELALHLDRPLARRVLDQWQQRMSPNALTHHLRGLLDQADNQPERAIAAIRRGLAANPRQRRLNPSLIAAANLLGDAALARELAGEMAAALPDHPDVQQTVAVTTAKAAVEGNFDQRETGPFVIEYPSQLSTTVLEQMLKQLQSTYQDLSRLFGVNPKPVKVRLVITPGVGDRIAIYDRAADRMILATMLADPDQMAVLVGKMYPEVSEAERRSFGEQFARHTLFHEFSHLMVAKSFEGAKFTGQAAWLHEGLAEVIGGEISVLSLRLRRVQAARQAGRVRFVAPSVLNQTLGQSTPKAEDLEAAYVQSYLMAAHLLKKSGGLLVGLALQIEAIRQLEGGASLGKVLGGIYQDNPETFQVAWQESAEPYLSKGQPISW